MIKQAAKGIDLHSSAFAKEMKLTRWQMTTINFLDKQPGQMVKLTDEAKDLLPGIQKEIKDDDLELLQHFSQEEIDTVRRLLKYIAEEG